MAVPTSYVWPLPKLFNENPQRYLDPVFREQAKEINRPLWRLEGQATVPAGNTSVSVAVDIDRDPYYIVATPYWNTSIWVDPTMKTLTAFVLNFGTAAPVGGGLVDWHIVQPEQGASYVP